MIATLCSFATLAAWNATWLPHSQVSAAVVLLSRVLLACTPAEIAELCLIFGMDLRRGLRKLFIRLSSHQDGRPYGRTGASLWCNAVVHTSAATSQREAVRLTWASMQKEREGYYFKGRSKFCPSLDT